MVEEPPSAFVAYNAVMCGPAHNGLQQFALEAERSVRIVTDSEAEQVTVASRVGEIVASIPFVHPRCLEKPMRVASLERFAVLINNDDRTWRLGKLQDIIAHAYHKRWQGKYI